MNLRALGLSLLTAAVGACGSDHHASATDDPNVGNGGNIDAGASKGADASVKHDGASTSKGSTGNNVCDSHQIQASSVVPDMLIVLDASLSMAALRWVPSVWAVSDLVKQYQSQISFGLELFPSLGLPSCLVGDPEVPLALNNADAITQRITFTAPAGLTPTGPALIAAAKVLGDRTQVGDMTKSTPGYVLLVTDGEPDCVGTDVADPFSSAMNGVNLLTKQGIKTFVIGYQIDPVGALLMDTWAMAGGTNKMFPVEDQMSLQAAFAAITQNLVSCTFDLSETPTDPSFVSVTIDGKQLNINAADGWVIDGKRVTLQGKSCDTLKDGTPHVLNATVECAPVAVF